MEKQGDRVAKQSNRIECHTPTEGRTGTTSIPRWKYDCIRSAILKVMRAADEDGLAFSDLKDAVRAHLSEEELSRLGSLGWHITTVKLSMEVDHDIHRLPGSPQRLVLVD